MSIKWDELPMREQRIDNEWAVKFSMGVTFHVTTTTSAFALEAYRFDLKREIRTQLVQELKHEIFGEARVALDTAERTLMNALYHSLAPVDFNACRDAFAAVRRELK